MPYQSRSDVVIFMELLYFNVLGYTINYSGSCVVLQTCNQQFSCYFIVLGLKSQPLKNFINIDTNNIFKERTQTQYLMLPAVVRFLVTRPGKTN